MTEFAVKEGDVIEEPSDLLLLKFAQNFYGADRAVLSRLVGAGLCKATDLHPRLGEAVVIDTEGAIEPKCVMFVGTPPLRSFEYDEMEEFARTAIEKIAKLPRPVKSITTTIHGTGYGLDGGESLQRLVAGFRKGLSQRAPIGLRQITFLTLGKRAERMLKTTLADIRPPTDTPAAKAPAAKAPAAKAPAAKAPAAKAPAVTAPREEEAPPPTPVPRPEPDLEPVLPAPETTPAAKKRVFVALPFSEDFQNVYDFGIYPAVRNCEFICERVDETHFTGDVLTRIRGSIETADLVIADLTEGRPNVYLEVGYAWGKGVPVIFVAKKGEQLHFDVSTHRCVFYGSFRRFARDLEDLIRGIQASRPTGTT